MCQHETGGDRHDHERSGADHSGHDHPGHDHSGHDRAAHAERRVAADTADASGILVEVTRGSMVESRHRGHAVVVDAQGHVVAYWGDHALPVFPRSAIKPVQAIPLIETGAFDAFGLGDAELALACASHRGEARHTDLAAAWLARIGCAVEDYECGGQMPGDAEAAHALIRRGEAPSALYNNCSGKHAGMLTTARHKGEPLKGYVRREHPVQQRILGVLEQMTGQDLTAAPWGIDGCSIPTIAIPLGAVALAMARIADPAGLPDRRAEAVTRIRRAWGAHPGLIHGRGGFDTLLMEAASGAVLVKGGAEGVSCAVLPEAGLGIALKIEDGANRAADAAMAAVLRHLGALPDEIWAAHPDLLTPTLRNWRGIEVGAIRPSVPQGA